MQCDEAKKHGEGHVVSMSTMTKKNSVLQAMCSVAQATCPLMSDKENEIA